MWHFRQQQPLLFQKKAKALAHGFEAVPKVQEQRALG